MTRRGFLAGLGSLPFLGFAKASEPSVAQSKVSPPREAVGSSERAMKEFDALMMRDGLDDEARARVWLKYGEERYRLAVRQAFPAIDFSAAPKGCER